MEAVNIKSLSKHKQTLSQLLMLSDSEMGVLSTKIIHTVIDFDKFDKETLYIIGVSTSNIQYNFRHLRSALIGENYDNSCINDLLKCLDIYGEYIILAKNKLVTLINNLGWRDLYTYLNDNKYSVYNSELNTKELDVFIRKLKKNYKKK